MKPEIEIGFRDEQIPVLVLRTSVVERLCPLFVTELQQILHETQNCCLFSVQCFWDKLEV